MKKNQHKQKTPKLRKLVLDFKISQQILADFAAISHSGMKQKLTESNETYFFTDREYSDLLKGLREMSEAINKFTRQHDRVESFKIYSSKK